jgi:hypothetical protein
MFKELFSLSYVLVLKCFPNYIPLRASGSMYCFGLRGKEEVNPR